MKLRVGLFLIIIFLVFKSFSGNTLIVAGGRSAAMGYTGVAVADMWSCFNNQAGMSWCSKFAIGTYFENRFLLKELSLKTIGVVFPLKKKCFGITFGHFGYLLYGEIKTGLAFSMLLGKKFSAGLQLDYLRIQQGEDYGGRNLFTFEFGLLYKINEKINLGVHICNPVPIKLVKNGTELLPVIFRFGLSWQLSESFLSSVEVEKELVLNPIIKGGIEYHFVKPLWIRLGFLSNPGQFTFGFGIGCGKFRFDLASSYHPVLGYSPQGSIIYTIN